MGHTTNAHSNIQKHEASGDDPYWSRAHHDWKFWLAFFLMLAGIGIYITSLDEATGPGPGGELRQQQPTP